MKRHANGTLSPVRVIGGFGAGRLLEIARALGSGGRRSVAEDARLVVSLIDPRPRVIGLDLVPRRDPFVLVANHYEARDLWVGWVAAAITAAVAEARAPGLGEMRWVVHPEWRWFEARGRWIPNPLSSLVFPRAIRVWGMLSLPARPSDVTGRARALRQILAHLRPRDASGPGALGPIGIFPEGRATSALQEARAGSGALLHRICKLGVSLLPAATYHEGSVLIVRFGPPFSIRDLAAEPRDELDAAARRQVMVEIGRLLPERLWGAYATEIAAHIPDSPDHGASSAASGHSSTQQ